MTVKKCSMGMTKRLVLVVPMLAASSAGAVVMAQSADEIHFTFTSPTSVTFDWRGTAMSLHYGKTGTFGNTVVGTIPTPLPFSSAGPFWEAKLTGLLANTLYHYKIGGRADHTFRTPPLPGSSGFTVAVQGDIGGSNSFPAVKGVQSVVNSIEPAFTLMVGDLTYGNFAGQATVDQHFNDVMVWSQEAAYMPAWGNHEYAFSDDLRNYQGRFDLPNQQSSIGSPPCTGCRGEDWSYFDYGNVRFISYPEPYDGDPASWTEWNPKAMTLMNQVDSDPNIKFIVTFGHRAAYSSGHHPQEQQPEITGILDALGDAHPKYVLNLNGHSHNWERSFPQHGVVHLTVGTGGQDLDQEDTPGCLYTSCPPPFWSAFRAFHFGVAKLKFTAKGIKGAFICGPSSIVNGENKDDVKCEKGDVLDTFKISPRQ